jgi:predicted Rossmann fold flavoprotein
MNMNTESGHFEAIFIGGGAASFFAAIRLAELVPGINCAILEKGKTVLNKVRISGGGRCNVTNAITDPRELSENYPRGQKSLIGPFNRFNSRDTVEWFESRGVELKTESDGRVFPVSDNSQSIVDCLMNEVKKYGIAVKTGENVKKIRRLKDRTWDLQASQNQYRCKQLFLGSGSSPAMWAVLSDLGLPIVEPHPSLFTFNINDPRIKGLQGISLPEVELKINGSPLKSTGPLLITHWGLSGPAILKLSAWGARQLAEMNYRFELVVKWMSAENAQNLIEDSRAMHPSEKVQKKPFVEFPVRLWRSLVEYLRISEETRWADLSKKQMNALGEQLSNCRLKVDGKSTFKEEFVTAGGVNLKAVDLREFRSVDYPNLFLAGEVLNIDAITGGFNFQAAWTGGWIAGSSMSKAHRSG